MMLIDPAGNALPCHAAAVIPNLQFENVRAHDLGWIWRESSAFQCFRGMRGCRTLVGNVPEKKSISVDAAVRPICLLEMRERSIQCAAIAPHMCCWKLFTRLERSPYRSGESSVFAKTKVGQGGGMLGSCSTARSKCRKTGMALVGSATASFDR
jgi:hypothetical protein